MAPHKYSSLLQVFSEPLLSNRFLLKLTLALCCYYCVASAWVPCPSSWVCWSLTPSRGVTPLLLPFTVAATLVPLPPGVLSPSLSLVASPWSSQQRSQLYLFSLNTFTHSLFLMSANTFTISLEEKAVALRQLKLLPGPSLRAPASTPTVAAFPILFSDRLFVPALPFPRDLLFAPTSFIPSVCSSAFRPLLLQFSNPSSDTTLQLLPSQPDWKGSAFTVPASPEYGEKKSPGALVPVCLSLILTSLSGA